jgi:phosphate:Na+ symporter
MEFWPLLAGLGFFLFGMTQLEDALGEIAGERFRDMLRRHADTPFKGLLVGAGTTMVLQSSALVLLLVLAFVGAGVIDLRGALGVVYGANLGTTATGWLVATLGFKFDLGRAALAFIGIGGTGAVLMPRGALRQLARLTMGLGLILFGLDQMKDGVEAWATSVDVRPFAGLGAVTLALIGLALTALIQSSSGTMMLALSALHGGILDLPAAAALVIGSNVGSTVTGLLGSLGGTPDKKRVSAAHLVFNAVTAVVALVLLEPMLTLVRQVNDPLIALVLFHTLFNLLGTLMFMPFTGRFATLLEARFVVPEQLVGRYIHRVEPSVPEVALAAIEQETRRAIGLAIRLNRYALRLHPDPGSPWGEREDERGELPQRLSYLERYQRLKRLEGELIGYATRVQQQGLAPEQTLRINQLLTTVRDAVLSAKAVKDVREDLVPLRHPAETGTAHPCETLHLQADAFYRAVDRLGPEVESSLLVQELARLRVVVRDQHQALLQDLYRNAARNGLDRVELSSMLNLNRALRRSARGLLRALAGYLLGPSEAEVLDQTGGD